MNVKAKERKRERERERERERGCMLIYIPLCLLLISLANSGHVWFPNQIQCHGACLKNISKRYIEKLKMQYVKFENVSAKHCLTVKVWLRR